MVSRRSVLKGGAALGVTSVTGLSGCLGLGGGGGGFQDWLVDPFLLAGEPERYFVYSIAMSSLDENADQFAREDYDNLRSFAIDRFGFTRLYADEVERVTLGRNGYQSGGFDVVQGGIDRETLGEDFRREEYRALEGYEGFDLYEYDEDVQNGAAVGDDTMAIAGSRGEADAVRVVESLVDTQRGEARSYADVDEDFESLMGATSPGDYLLAGTQEPTDETNAERGQFRNQVGFGQSATVNGEESELELVLTFLDERDVRERDIEDWTRASDAFRLWRDLEFELDGPVATVTATVPTRDLTDALLS